MALIECAESLSSSTKGKLQDAGILYVSEVVALLSSTGYGAGSDGDGKPASALRHLSTVWKHYVSPSDPRGTRRPRRDTSGDDLGGFDGQGEPASASLSIEATAPSNYHKEAEASRFLNLTEDEMREIVEMAARAAVGADGEHEGGKDTASSARERDFVHGVMSSSPPRAPAFSSRSADSAPKAREHAHKSDSRSGAIPGCRTVREMHAEFQACQAQGFPTHVTTFSRELDGVLGGGVPVGGVTEISGPPGVGKTQLLMQLAVSCAMPVEFGGMGGACLYVDTEGSFVAERLEQMATAAVSLVRAILLTQPQRPRNETTVAPSSDARLPRESPKKRGRSPPRDPQKTSRSHGDCTDFSAAPGIQAEFTVESVLQRVHYIRVTDLAGLLALLHSLPSWFEEERIAEAKNVARSSAADTPTHSSGQDNSSSNSADAAVRMVLIDSIALPFRSFDDFHRDGLMSSTGSGGDNAVHLLGYTGMSAVHNGLPLQSPNRLLSKHGLWRRSRLLFQCSTLLERLAATFQLAIVVTNHMTTKMLHGTTVNGTSAEGSGYSAPNGEVSAGQLRQSVLIPALGDAWGQGLSTRLLLSFHHYDVPACSFVDRPTSPTAATECMEDVVYSLSSRQQQPKTSLRSVVQHRVVRVLKCSGQPRRETCFAVTSKGIRDARRDIVSQRVSKAIGAREPHE
ncbi:putative recombinase rad51 [Leishmania mexicana MHOM/GT/2001/U1103]|uniref:DNA repair protein RAD51 homolog 3 n=1 Tax=Leishmania mexicana (strain MHOM/GT/2001/U1103) TaxID=929439 RepID=E9B488_LEIMU|nr:putative recombinase rad51 [Leishmania mexicana MHOM/GT/2001/U1103]CBZ30056.1 putative recombinase rad51 [Leishmania mexicana MHOM/GT/2001/U1103]